MKKFVLMPMLLIGSSQVYAHTPYLMPHSFEPVRGNKVTLDASFSEKFFIPEVAFTGSEFFVIAPNGKRETPEKEAELTTRKVLEHSLKEEGTYRFSTGQRKGAIFRVYMKDGKRGSLRGNDEPLPEGAKITDHFQAITYAETWVPHKGPTSDNVKPLGNGLEIVPVTHPNDVFSGDKFSFTVHYNGKPLPDAKAFIYLANYQFSEEKAELEVTTDSAGNASFSPEEQGVYVLRVRHRDAAPEGADVPRYSYTTTLTLEAY